MPLCFSWKVEGAGRYHIALSAVARCDEEDDAITGSSGIAVTR